MTVAEQREIERQDLAIAAAAAALMAVCAVQTGADPQRAFHRALGALSDVRAAQEGQQL